MDKYKPGDVFISSLTQKVVIVEEDYSQNCHDGSCVYSNSICKYNKSERTVEAGFCAGGNREDNISIYFKEIPEQISDLVLEIRDNSAIKKKEKLELYELLLKSIIKDGK